MAIPFLSDIKLNGNQIKELVVDHKSGSQPTSAYHGQLIFRTDQNKIYINQSTTYGSPSWSSIAGDITSITAGNGLTTPSGVTGDVTINAVGGDGITVGADEIEATVDGSTIELSATDGSGAIRIKDSGVATDKIADNAVTLAKLAHQTNDTVFKVNGSGVPTAGTIATSNVADDAITYAKIQDVSATNRILGRDSTGSGIIEEITPANVRTMLNVEDGANNYSLDLSKLNTVTSAMTGDNTLTFGDSGDDTQVTIKGNLTVIGTTTTNNVETVSTSNGIQFEGTAADGHDAILKSVVASSDKTYTLPNITGHIPILTNAPGTTAISATVAEINLLDGDTSATSTSIVDADRVIVNDAGTMKQVAFSDIATYIAAQITSRELTVELDASEGAVTKSGNVYTVTHSFGTRNVLCQVIEDNSNSDDGSYQTIVVDVDRVSDATVEVDFGQTVTDGHYRILIHKIG